jgi:uncharacterized protein YndB with AHSA1/START domain/DNA-binding transcriptional ArsR family regulator
VDDEEVFKALADETRRSLLDRLYRENGLSLKQLEAGLDMTRFGVMKHLRQLETAGLVVTRKVGRVKLHYLNPVPIQQIYDRWMSKYTAKWAGALTTLKAALEREAPIDGPQQVYQLYIRTTPDRLWRAITTDEGARKSFGCGLEIDLRPGGSYRYTQLDGSPAHFGTLLEVDPPRRLVQTFEHAFSAEHGGGPADRSRVTWEVEPRPGGVCKLTLVHDGWASESQSFRSASEGWPRILSALKTLMETGGQLPVMG